MVATAAEESVNKLGAKCTTWRWHDRVGNGPKDGGKTPPEFLTIAPLPVLLGVSSARDAT